MPGFSEISPAQLMRRFGGADAPLVLDVRTEADFTEDPCLVPTSRHLPHTQAVDRALAQPRRDIVVVCQKGKKLSHGVAAHLRATGVVAEVLEGGTVGWHEACMPRVPAAALPGLTSGGTLWVTRHRPRVDRIACPWLLRRFVDPDARILYVPPEEVAAVADRFDATAFDMPGGAWSHQGDTCSFDTFIANFGLAHPALDRLAPIVRAADTGRDSLVPQAAGLSALSVGLSRLHRDDHSQLEAAMAIYDALYRWARDGFDETHDAPEAQ